MAIMEFSKGAALDYLAQQFGGSLREVPAVVTVGTSVVQAAAPDVERISLTFVNLSGTEMFIAPENIVSASRGMRLGPNGGTVSVNVTEDGTLPTAEWFALGGAAALSLYVLGVRREAAYK